MNISSLLCLLGIISFSSHAQNSANKAYFDKAGKSCSQEKSYYYRVASDTADFYRCFYTQNGNLYFQGVIKSINSTDDNKNVYAGNCKWYYRNGQLQTNKTFDVNGAENGISQYYYEAGRLWKEIEYQHGIRKGLTHTEYNEDGSRNKIFEDEFSNNAAEWDIYTSDKSSSQIHDGLFELRSTSKEGTSRYINYPIESDEYTIEASVNISALKENDKAGIIYGFKDWQNYHYFAISKKNIYIGSFYEGVKAVEVQDMYCSSIDPLRTNVLKILNTGEKEYFSVNGEIQYKGNINRLFGNNFGLIASGNSNFKTERFVIKEMGAGGSRPQTAAVDNDVKKTGSGILFSTSGYILTNHHVVENSTRFNIELSVNGIKSEYRADLIISDKDNDIAILQIKDPVLPGMEFNYSFKENGLLDVGSSVFTIGFPYALAGMGKEAKFTDGKVSAKTGYNGNINSFQTTIPVQPGNSGGPVFNENGQLVGLINATYKETDNVSYAVKLNYIKNLIELLPDKIDLPNSSVLAGLSLPEKLKIITNYVVLIKVK